MAAVCSVSGLQDKPEEQLRAHLEQARISKLSVSIAGTRHTMGGHTSTPGGLILDMLGLHEMHLDEQSNILHVQAGARWSDVLRYVHERGRSIQVMQSNSSFSVGGSLGANCHGWQPLSPPISSTVVAFRLLLADGMVIRCSREEHAELFSLALGGYGLFGVLLDAELSVTANERYRATRWVVPSAEYPSFYEEQTKRDVSIGLAYGRFNFVPPPQLEPFLEQVRAIIPAHQADLLNVTIRFVAPDQESFLRYADQNLFALVMLFHQPRTLQADQQMARLTRGLIDAALALGGRYYLPYRLHATLEQFYRAYPQAPQFFKLKRQYDPEDLFQNEWYRKYRVGSGN